MGPDRLVVAGMASASRDYRRLNVFTVNERDGSLLYLYFDNDYWHGPQRLDFEGVPG